MVYLLRYLAVMTSQVWFPTGASGTVFTMYGTDDRSESTVKVQRN